MQSRYQYFIPNMKKKSALMCQTRDKNEAMFLKVIKTYFQLCYHKYFYIETPQEN